MRWTRLPLRLLLQGAPHGEEAAHPHSAPPNPVGAELQSEGLPALARSLTRHGLLPRE